MRCAVLGSPIEHSLSPVLHRAAYAELGLDWTYDAIEVREAELATFLDGLDSSWRGLSLTMPLKREVVGLLDEPDALVTATGVANTVVFDAGRRRGFNTDIPGAVDAILERSSAPVQTAVVLGGGATAASLGWALADLGCAELSLFVRNLSTVAETVAVIEQHPVSPAVTVATLEQVGDVRTVDVVASTIPVEAQTHDLIEALDRTAATVVFDVIYDPWPTPMATWAAAGGRAVVNGLDLLCHQAAHQVELMTGARPSVPLMRGAGLAALAARHRDAE